MMDNTMLVIFRDLKLIQDVLGFSSAYIVTLLLRCTLISYGLITLVLLVRSTILKRTVFLKGIIWSAFLLLPFLGKLKAYYDESHATIPFVYCQEIGISLVWFRVLYFTVTGVMLFRLFKTLKNMDRLRREAVSFDTGTETVWIIDLPISPCASGLFKPRILLPEDMVEELSQTELNTIITHEKVHIRLGHLWIFFIWEVLSAVFWMNPLMKYSFRFLREDMEQICDHVTITLRGQDPCAYGELILRNIVRTGNDPMRIPAMFIGGNGKKEIRERFIKISEYSPCSRKRLIVLFGTVCAVLTMSFIMISKFSYPKYEILPDITITDDMGNVLAGWDKIENSGAIERTDDRFVVDAEKLRTILPENMPDGQYLIFYYDIFMKIPGMGGGGYCAWIEDLPMQGKIEATTEKHELRDDLAIWLIKCI